MIWSRLKNAACPKCNKFLEKDGVLGDRYFCSSKKCDFSISEERFNEIITDMYKPSQRTRFSEDDRLSELNNL